MNLKKLFIIFSCLFMFSSINALEIKSVTKSNYKNENQSSNYVEIKNIDDSTGEYIKDSTFQILDEDGFVLVEWISAGEEQIVEGLTEGTYYLIQISVDNNYEINANKIKFEITDSVVTLEMKNSPKKLSLVSLSATNVLLVFMAMLNIALIIGALCYVKKNKTEK